ncbi:hypothetical protein CDC46_28125, partial (plasmid) [Ralstonia solanacearum]|uniref:hypothetical protein n=1 Tax=Ralstonia solanacearum TaxID=305 RepID=UPI001B3B3A1E
PVLSKRWILLESWSGSEWWAIQFDGAGLARGAGRLASPWRRGANKQAWVARSMGQLADLKN